MLTDLENPHEELRRGMSSLKLRLDDEQVSNDSKSAKHLLKWLCVDASGGETYTRRR
jgi:hypothetical protein